MVGSYDKHEWLCGQIYKHPDLIGLTPKDVQGKSTTYALTNENGGVITIPDISFKLYDAAHFVEIKSAPTDKLFSKGMSQLEKILNWCEHNGIDNYDATLVMPHRDAYTQWRKMLSDLELYKAGDAFHHPTGSINEAIYRLYQ